MWGAIIKHSQTSMWNVDKISFEKKNQKKIQQSNKTANNSGVLYNLSPVHGIDKGKLDQNVHNKLSTRAKKT